jgi:hypothetical protein
MAFGWLSSLVNLWYMFMHIHVKCPDLLFSCFFLEQNVKAYLRRGTAREILGYYKEAIDGLSLSLCVQMHTANILLDQSS